MSRLRLLFRTLWYFRWPNLATLLGIAVGTAVLAGSLIVGDSVRESLRRIVNDRLGDIDYVLVCPHFFGQSLADRLAGRDSGIKAEALITTTGNCTEPEAGRHVPRVQVFGRGGIEPGTCVVSQPLAEAVGAAEGKTLIVRMHPAGGTPFEVPFEQRDGDMASLRLKVARVAPKTEMEGAFSFYASQRPVRNVWVSLDDLQQVLNAPEAANMLAVSWKGVKGTGIPQGMLKTVTCLRDYGLRLVEAGKGTLSLESDSIFLNQAVEQAALKLTVNGPRPGVILSEAKNLNVPRVEMLHSIQHDKQHRMDVLAYLANTVKDIRNGCEFPYSMVAGISALPEGTIGPDEVVLNQWAADDLKAELGDEIELAYFVRGPGGPLEEKRAKFHLARIIGMDGIGADKTLVPRFKGVTNAAKMSQWNPPPDFDFHADRIRKLDEDYWQRYGAAPKAFVNIETARRLWATRFGALTSIRFPGISKDDLTRGLLAELSPASMGLVFRAIRFEQSCAAEGNTDFSQLFIGFSFFLVVSAGMLVVLLLRLSVDQRSRQIGILLAEGFTERAVRRLLLSEGMILLVIGAAVGTIAAVGYAWLMMAGLRTVWREAVGTTLLALHVNVVPIVIGFLAGVLLGAFAVWRGRTGRFKQDRISETIAGKRISEQAPQPVRVRSIGLAAALFAIALILIGVAVFTDKIGPAIAFFAAGSLLLIALLLGMRAFMLWVQGARTTRFLRLTTLGFGIRNAARNRGRSMLTVGVLASAYFILFAVGSMKSKESDILLDKHGGTGGYALIAEFDIPLPYDIGLAKGRRYLGMNTSDEELWKRVIIVNMRASSGEDASCRNLYRPSTPRILSVPDEMVEEDGFAFTSAIEKAANPWELLRKGSEHGVPIIADSETAQWILHKGLGETIPIVDENGEARSLQIIALLKMSMFQGEALMGEKDFLSIFPIRSGYQTLLIKASPEDAKRAREIILHDLGEFGATVETTQERMASYLRIANSYISAFEMLGGFGVLIGSVGLVVVLVRGVVERRNELALMAALGFRRRSVVHLILTENVFLLFGGIFAGVLSAILATLPQILKNGLRMNLVPMSSVMLTILVSLLLFIITASWIVHRITPASLRRE